MTRRSLISRALCGLRPNGCVDKVTSERISGWAFGRGDINVEAWINGKRVVRSAARDLRKDVATTYPGRRGALNSGFSLPLPREALQADSISELKIVARPTVPWMLAATLGTFQLAGNALQQALERVEPANIVSPFPRSVTDIVAARWPEDCSDLLSEMGQRRFVERLKQLLETPGVNSLPALVDYARYLTATLAHCWFVEKHFPAGNSTTAGASDFHCKPNSVREIFPIIHHLYVLRSWGVEGDFAEFGCFKGYSSAMLSFACQQLGLTMHIFDSFEGLPPSEDSGYVAGQFAGSLDEVRENIGRFGSLEAVRLHKGFFADTFRDWQPPALNCLWMDVDLESSSRDLLVVADRLDRRGAVFSHECSGEIFDDGQITTAPAPDNPIPPILTRFEDLGRPLTGHHVAGYTGAFWPRDGGIPVLTTNALFDLVSTRRPRVGLATKLLRKMKGGY